MGDAVRARLQEVIGLIDAGRIDNAEALCRESLARDPDEINLLGLLGAILLKKGGFAEAEKCLLRTIELEPTFAKPYEDLGVLYMARNEPDRAAQFFDKSAELGGSRESAMHLLAVANRYRQSGDHGRAQQICADVLERDAGNVAALRLLAIIASDTEQYREAENYLRQIMKLSPGQPSALIDLGTFLGDRSRFSEAIEVLQQAAALDETNPQIQLALGDMLAIVGRDENSLQAYERCLEQRPNEPAALVGRGHMLRIAGRRDAAEQSYRQAIQVAPDMGQARWNLASLHGFSATDDEIKELQTWLDSGEISPESEVGFRFALARALEKREDFAGAWEQYELGNACKRALVKYDPVDTELQQRKIRDAFGAGSFRKATATTPKDNTPIFIVGMPRSGSTLIEQILASHSLVEGCGELPYIIMLSKTLSGGRTDGLRYPELISALDASQLTALGRTYLHHATTHRSQKTPCFTDKMPANFSHVGFIRLILPHAKIIDARRNPMATCVANYRQLYAQGKHQSYDLAELGEYYLQYAELMQHWDEVIPGAVLHVQYEDVVADLDAQVRRLLGFCELPFEQACLDYHESARSVNTASSEQVREPIYTSAVEFWRNYETHLDELRNILAPVLHDRDSD